MNTQYRIILFIIIFILFICISYTTIADDEKHLDQNKIIFYPIINPNKVRPGDIMKISTVVFNSPDIKKIDAICYHEKGKDTISLKCKFNMAISSIWVGEWIVHDTKIKEYNTTIVIYSKFNTTIQRNISWFDPPVPWWNSNWNNRKSHTIIGSVDKPLSNYTIKITTFKSSGTDSNNHVYLGDKVQDDFDDVRFIDNNGDEMPFIIDKLNSGVNATFWIKIPSIPLNPTNTNITVYYNNPSATSNSSIKNTFPQAIDFSIDTILSYGGSQDSGGAGEWSTNTAENYIRFGLGTNRANNWKAINVGNLDITSEEYALCFWYKSDGNEAEVLGVGHDTELNSIESGKTYQIEGTQGWGRTDITQYDRGEGDWQYLETVLNDYSGLHRYITIVHDNDAGPNSDDFFKNIRVRKYTENEPIHSTWGNEESKMPTKPILNPVDENNYTNNPTPLLQWGTSQNAENYRILVDDEPDLDDNDENINVSIDASSTSYTIPGVDALSEGTWYWKVVAYNPQAENESYTGNFMVDTTNPSTVELVSPINKSNTTSTIIIFQWNETNDTIGGSGRNHYQLQVSDVSDFNSLIINDNSTGVESISKTISESDVGILFWRVRVWDNADNAGDWSPYYNLTIFDFDIKVDNQDSINLQLMKGQSRTISLSLIKEYEGNENKLINLSYSWLDTIPSGILVDFASDEIFTSNQTTITFEITNEATTGSYTCQIIGIWEDFNRSATVELTSTGMLFSIESFPQNFFMVRDDEATSSLSIEFDMGQLNTVFLTGSWNDDTPLGVETTISRESGLPPFESDLTFITSKTAEAGTFTYKVTGTGSGLIRTKYFIINISKQLSLTLQSDKESYEKGEYIDFSGAVKDPADQLVNSGTVTLNFNSINWSDTITSEINNGYYSTSYYISFDRPVGTWNISANAVDNHGHQTINDLKTDLSVVSPDSYENLDIEVITPQIDQSFDRGEEITITLSIKNQQGERITGAIVKGWFSIGDTIDFTEGSLGIYTGRYRPSYNFPSGNQNIYVEGKKISDVTQSIGFTTIPITVENVTPILNLIKPAPGSLLEIGEIIQISLSVKYPDGTPFEQGIIVIKGPDGKNITLIASSQKGQYIGEYKIIDIARGNWTLITSVVDAFGNQLTINAGEMEIVDSKISTLILRYWWISTIVITIIFVFLSYMMVKKLRKKKLINLNQQILKLEKLKKRNAVLYFTKGEISRKTYDRLIHDNETNISHLTKKQRILARKIQKSSNKWIWWSNK